MSTTPRPLIPTGSPPCPAIPSVNTNTSSWSTSMNTVVSGWERLTPSPCASWISRPISTPSCPEVSGKRLSRRRARTAKVPDLPLVSAIAAAEIASGVFATRSGRHTRAMPGTSPIRSAIWPTARAQASSPRCSPSATRSRMTPSRWRRSTGTPRSRTATRMLPCRMRSNCCLFRPLSTISPSLISTHGSSGAGNSGTPPVCQQKIRIPNKWWYCFRAFPEANPSSHAGVSPSVFRAARR